MPRKKKTPAVATLASDPLTGKKDIVETVSPGNEAQEEIRKIVSETKAQAETTPTGKPSRSYKRELEELKARYEGTESQAIQQGFKVMSGALLDIICVRLPNPIPPTSQEREIFGEAAGALAAKYADSFGQYKEEITFGLATVLILFPRFKREEAQRPERKPADATEGNTPAGQNGERQVHVGEEAS
jgi:hypothetical protein